MWKVMERGGNGRLYYADEDGVNELTEQGSLELGDRIYVEDVMYYAGNNGELYDEDGTAMNDEAAASSSEVAE